MADVCFRDPELLNWLQCSYSLRDLKSFLGKDIAEDDMKKFHASLFSNLWDKWCTGACQFKKDTSYLPDACAACNKAFKAIEKSHGNKGAMGDSLMNCDWQVLQTEGGYCQLAKLYMPKGIKQNVTDLNDIDASGIFNMCSNFKPLRTKCSKLKDTHKMTYIRNGIMHSPTLKVNDADKKQIINDMIKFLDDMKMNMKMSTVTDKILEKLKENRDTDLVIATRIEMEQAVYAIQNKMECIEQRLSSLEEKKGGKEGEEKLQQEIATVRKIAENCPALNDKLELFIVRYDQTLKHLEKRFDERFERTEKELRDLKRHISKSPEAAKQNSNPLNSHPSNFQNTHPRSHVNLKGDSTDGGLLWFENYSLKVRNKRVDDRLISKIADDMGHKWWNVGVNLGFTRPKLENFQHNHPHHVSGTVGEMLGRWKARDGARATVQKLVEALVDAEVDEDGYKEPIIDYLEEQ